MEQMETWKLDSRGIGLTQRKALAAYLRDDLQLPGEQVTRILDGAQFEAPRSVINRAPGNDFLTRVEKAREAEPPASERRGPKSPPAQAPKKVPPAAGVADSAPAVPAKAAAAPREVVDVDRTSAEPAPAIRVADIYDFRPAAAVDPPRRGGRTLLRPPAGMTVWSSQEQLDFLAAQRTGGRIRISLWTLGCKGPRETPAEIVGRVDSVPLRSVGVRLLTGDASAASTIPFPIDPDKQYGEDGVLIVDMRGVGGAQGLAARVREIYTGPDPLEPDTWFPRILDPEDAITLNFLDRLQRELLIDLRPGAPPPPEHGKQNFERYSLGRIIGLSISAVRAFLRFLPEASMTALAVQLAAVDAAVERAVELTLVDAARPGAIAKYQEGRRNGLSKREAAREAQRS